MGIQMERGPHAAANGMVVNIEPSLYTFDDLAVGSVEHEDTIIVTETGSRRLTDYPYEPRLLA
jgi:Xaa-Pro aminopeptidase